MLVRLVGCGYGCAAGPLTLGGWARWISPAVGADGVTRTGAACRDQVVTT